MLPINIPEREYWNEKKQEFVMVKSCKLLLEHSLISISKWESKWKKPFLSKDPKTHEESQDYVRCMTLNKDVDPLVYYSLTPNDYNKISEYIDDTMTATWFNDAANQNHHRSQQVITSELIYYWMVAYNIPFECEKWHLNRLLTLVKICDIKNSPKKKMGKKQIYDQQRKLNDARRQRLGTSG